MVPDEGHGVAPLLVLPFALRRGKPPRMARQRSRVTPLYGVVQIRWGGVAVPRSAFAMASRMRCYRSGRPVYSARTSTLAQQSPECR